MDMWGPARVRGQGHEHYFLLVVDDYSRYTTVFPLRSKGEVTEVLIDWIRVALLQLRERFGSEFPVLRLHSDTGGEFSSDLLRAFCHVKGICQTFTLPASPQQNGIAERRIGMVMDVARTSMIHAAAPHFLWPFEVQYAAHQLNLQPGVSMPETSPTLRWTGKVGDASAFCVWGSRAFVRDLSADKLSSPAVPCVFLGFPPDARGWRFYHPTSRRVLSSQDVTFDESVPYYHLFPYRTAPLPPPPIFLTPVPTPVDPLPPQGPAPSGVSQVDAVEVVVDSGTSGGAEPACEEPGGSGSGGAEPEHAKPGGAGSCSAEPERAEPEGAGSGGAEPGPSGGAGGTAGAGGSASAGGAGATSPGGARTGATGAAGRGGATGAGATGAAGASGATGVGITGGTGAGAAESSGGPAGAGGAAGGTGAGGAAGAGASVGAGVDATGAAGATAHAGGAAGVGADAAGAVSAGSGGAMRPRPYFAGPTGGLAERREPESRPASAVRTARTSRCVPRQRPPAVPSMHQIALRPSTASQRVPLPSPPASSLPALADPESDSLRAASPTGTGFLAIVVTDPSFESAPVSALVAELVDFAAHCRLDYAASLVVESASVCPPSVGGECALSTDVLEDRQEEFQCFAAALPHLVSTLLF
ncbi:unnamed protein product [Closterium sp. NIES-54]